MKTTSQLLIEQLYVPLISFIEEIIEDHEEARDIAVEVFRKNLAELEGYDSTDDLTELIKLLQNKAHIESTRFLQERKQNQEEARVSEPNCFTDYEDSVEQTLITKEMWCRVIKEAGLTRRQRLAIRLFLKGVRTKDAAGIMKIRESTFRVLIHNAIKKYRLALKAGGFLIIVILIIICANAR